MFQPFLTVLADLQARCVPFDAEALKLLSYPDLFRAATGDAGTSACDLELVEAERDLRLVPWLDQITISTLQAHRNELKDLGMFDDVAARVHARVMTAMPAWDSLSYPTRAYFLIRCLRSHVDDPTDRISRLQMYLDRWEPEDPQLKGLRALLRMATDELLEVLHVKGSLDIKHVRRRFQGFEFLTKNAGDWENAVVASLAVKGYSCTAGCFSMTHED